MIGLHLSQYRIDAELGRGGMGIVYRATDTKLNRTVAVKVLPPSALASEDDRARFFREAQAAAQLSHPNVCHVYQVDEAIPHGEGADAVPGGEKRPFIAMEYIEGETLQERIKKGPLKLAEAVSIAVQVAEALKAAHAKHIVHRDIKSANVMLTADGVAKVLDFGLAKTQASTMLTRQGSTLGTVAYMSPEQARGQEVDSRSDLYSLGTVLYEMVAGRLPFGGDYEQAILYGILNEPPEPLTAVRTGVPMELERLVGKLITKEADYRYQTAADLLADLKSLDLGGSGHSRRSMASATYATSAGMPMAASPASAFQRWVWPLLGVAVLTGIVVGWVLHRPPEPVQPPVRTMPLVVPDVSSARVLDVSSDGRSIVASLQGADGIARVMVFSTETGEWSGPLDLSFTEIVQFSPNGEWLLASRFNVTGTIIRYRLADDRPQPLPLDGGVATWLNDEEILYSAPGAGLWRADADGQGARQVAASDSIPPMDVLWFARPLPGGRLATVSLGAFNGIALGVVDLETGEVRRIADNVCCARYLPTGHLLYSDRVVSAGTFMLRPFEADRAEFSGVEVPAGMSPNPFNQIGVGADGTLAYIHAGEVETAFQYYWIGSDGRLVETVDDFTVGPMLLPYGESAPVDWGRSGIEHVTLSNDGSRFVAARFVDGEYRVFVNDLASGSSQRVSFDGPSGWPTWSPDDRWIYYIGRRSGKDVILRRRSDLAAAEEVVLVGNGQLSDPAFVPDGSRMLYYTVNDDVGHIVSLADTTRDEVYSATRAYDPAVAPDGRYVAFESDGLDVLDLNGTARYQVAPEFGDAWDPAWSADGRYLYYRDATTLYRVQVETKPVFRSGSRETVAVIGGNFHFALHPDGERILIQGSVMSRAGVSADMRVVFNWFTAVERLAPRSR